MAARWHVVGHTDILNIPHPTQHHGSFAIFGRFDGIGRIDRDVEAELVAEAKAWIEERAGACEAYAAYLGHWGDWANPWVDSAGGDA